MVGSNSRVDEYCRIGPVNAIGKLDDLLCGHLVVFGISSRDAFHANHLRDVWTKLFARTLEPWAFRRYDEVPSNHALSWFQVGDARAYCVDDAGWLVPHDDG